MNSVIISTQSGDLWAGSRSSGTSAWTTLHSYSDYYFWIGSPALLPLD